jgi:tRNA G18 (ribose-2'-O)-methylase SpoU
MAGLLKTCYGEAVPLNPVADLNDPRLAPYRELKDRDIAREHGLFIAEGEHLVRRLLASDFATHSLFLADRRVEEIAPLVPADVPVFVAPAEVLNRTLGFKFHSGVIAAGVRPTPVTLAELFASDPLTMRLAVCPELATADNLGALIRLSAGFGADALVIGPRSHDPFNRRTVRVSMGTIFKLPVISSGDLTADLQELRSRRGVHCIASVLDDTATPLRQAKRHARTAILFGNEAQGLDHATIAACDERVTIPMRKDTDSLNVATAAGIFMYHYWSE